MSFTSPFRLFVVLSLLAHFGSPASALAKDKPVVAPDKEATAAAPLPAARPQAEQVFPVGQWPEGVVVSAGSVWVAQSGERTVARLDPATGAVQATIKIGRLPVSMGVAPDGAPIVQVNTNKRVSRIDPKSNKAKILKVLPDGPEQMVVAGGFAYVLLWKNDSSAGSSVLRLNLASGASTRSVDTGENAFGLAVGGGQVWVALAGGRLAVLDASTLALKAPVAVAGRPYHVVAGGGAVFVSDGNAVVRVSTVEPAVTGRLDLPLPVSAMAAWDDLVVVATRDGTVWLLEPASLVVRARLKPKAPYDAQAIARDGKTLWLTHHGDAANGRGSLVRVVID